VGRWGFYPGTPALRLLAMVLDAANFLQHDSFYVFLNQKKKKKKKSAAKMLLRVINCLLFIVQLNPLMSLKLTTFLALVT
jgi:hypothetical protein